MFLLGAMLTGGCALNGDFDRVRPELGTNDMHARVGRDAVASIGLPPSVFPLTDDERQLRDLAYAMIAPPYDRNRWDSVFEEYVVPREHGLGRALPEKPAKFDRTAYWRHLSDEDRRSETSAYGQLITDARNDVLRLEPFFAVAARVADMDRKRAGVVARVPTSKAEHNNARFRNNENTAVVAWVCRALNERALAYGYALERLVIRAPSRTAVDVERSLAMLASRIGEYCRASPPGAVVAVKN